MTAFSWSRLISKAGQRASNKAEKNRHESSADTETSVPSGPPVIAVYDLGLENVVDESLATPMLVPPDPGVLSALGWPDLLKKPLKEILSSFRIARMRFPYWKSEKLLLEAVNEKLKEFDPNLRHNECSPPGLAVDDDYLLPGSGGPKHSSFVTRGAGSPQTPSSFERVSNSRRRGDKIAESLFHLLSAENVATTSDASLFNIVVEATISLGVRSSIVCAMLASRVTWLLLLQSTKCLRALKRAIFEASVAGLRKVLDDKDVSADIRAAHEKIAVILLGEYPATTPSRQQVTPAHEEMLDLVQMDDIKPLIEVVSVRSADSHRYGLCGRERLF